MSLILVVCLDSFPSLFRARNRCAGEGHPWQWSALKCHGIVVASACSRRAHPTAGSDHSFTTSAVHTSPLIVKASTATSLIRHPFVLSFNIQSLVRVIRHLPPQETIVDDSDILYPTRMGFVSDITFTFT